MYEKFLLYTVSRVTFRSWTKFVGDDNRRFAAVKAYRGMTGYVSHAFLYKC